MCVSRRDRAIPAGQAFRVERTRLSKMRKGRLGFDEPSGAKMQSEGHSRTGFKGYTRLEMVSKLRHLYTTTHRLMQSDGGDVKRVGRADEDR